MRIPQTVCGFHLQFADCATAHFNYTHALFFVCGLPIYSAILSGTVFKVFACGNQNSKEENSSNVADSATYLILTSCGIRLQCTESRVWPRNVSVIWEKQLP